MATRSVIIKKDIVDDVFKNIGLADQYAVLVGYPSSTSDRDDGVSNAVLGYIHEHGSPVNNIPARPHLVPGVQAAETQVIAVFRQAVIKALQGDKGAINNALALAGEVAASSVKNYIRSGAFTPLSPQTVKRKGSSKPLIDTGQLLNSVTYVIRPKQSLTEAEPKPIWTAKRPVSAKTAQKRAALKMLGDKANKPDRDEEIPF